MKPWRRYPNERAGIAAKFRDVLIEGAVAIPDVEMLLQELRVYSAFTNQSGKLQCVSKEDLRRLLGRSPDRLNAVLMACAGPNEIDFGRVPAVGPVAF